MPDLLTRRQLDTMMCEEPGCDHTAHDGLFLHARCHMSRPPEVEYKSGLLLIRCSVCKRAVAHIKVADS